MADPIAAAVHAALAAQLGLSADAVAAQAERGLDQLGLDSHGLMRVLLDLEQRLGLSDLDLADDHLASPATMVAGIRALV